MREKKTKIKKPESLKVDIDSYQRRAKDKPYLANLEKIAPGQREDMLSVGVDSSEKNRSGTYLQMDHSVVHARSLIPGLW